MKSRWKGCPVPPTERRRFLTAAGGLALLAALPNALPTSRAQGRGLTPIPGTPPAPALRLTDADERTVDLAALRGKVVLVNFWATWCPPCRTEFPSLGRVRKRFDPARFEVLAVNVGEDAETVFSFTGHTAFPVLFDPDSKAMAGWSVRGLPTTFLVDRQGRLAAKAVGGREFDDPDIIARIQKLLKPQEETA